MDYAATTPLDEQVLAAMESYWSDTFANPAGLYEEGVVAKEAVEKARDQVAKFLSCKPDEIIFTSGGTEAQNLALQGFVRKVAPRHIVTSAIEHASGRGVFEMFERQGIDVSYTPVDGEGRVVQDEFEKSLQEDTGLVSIMHANNEVGTIQDIKSLSTSAKKKSAQCVFHTDASQSALFYDLSVQKLSVDLMTVDAHKMYGPKGVGALYVKQGTPLEPLMYGGGHEQSLRPGTLNVPGIVGFGEACVVAQKNRESFVHTMRELQTYFIEKLTHVIPQAVLNGPSLGSRTERLPNNINVSFPDVESDFLVLQLNKAGIAVSSKSACLSVMQEGSRVVHEIGGKHAESAIRFSFGKTTTKEEIDRVLEVLGDILR